MSSVLSDLHEKFERLPGVYELLETAQGETFCEVYGRAQAVEAFREALDTARAMIRKGEDVADADSLLRAATTILTQHNAPSLRPLINATGVIIHTNLGRAPLSDRAIEAMRAAAAGYSTLEYDLDSGKRGKRDTHAERILCDVTGAEAALVVNNNAAAVLLILQALAVGREVAISRGQLVEIGGGFRIPDVMAQSGARLVEVGTTNRTRLADFERVINEETAMLMVAHASNFKIVGFTEQPPLAHLATLAHERDLPLFNDLGSGILLDTASYGLAHEPTVQETLKAGCDLVSFSGDKLLGGPQAGLIVGRSDLVDTLKRHPLARAVRMGKLNLAALVATLDSYRRDKALEEIPVWRMISTPLATLQARAESWQEQIGAGEVIAGQSTVGGGSLPGETLPTAILALDVHKPDEFAAALRAKKLPIVARIADERVLLDPRTVLPGQDEALVESLRQVIKIV